MATKTKTRKNRRSRNRNARTVNPTAKVVTGRVTVFSRVYTAIRNAVVGISRKVTGFVVAKTQPIVNRVKPIVVGLVDEFGGALDLVHAKFRPVFTCLRTPQADVMLTAVILTFIYSLAVGSGGVLPAILALIAYQTGKESVFHIIAAVAALIVLGYSRVEMAVWRGRSYIHAFVLGYIVPATESLKHFSARLIGRKALVVA